MSPLGVVVLVGCLCLAPLTSAQDGRAGAAPPPAAGKTAPPAAKPAGAAQAGKPAAPAAAAAMPAAAPAAAGAASAAPAAGQRAATPADGAATPPDRQTYYLALLHHGPKWVAEGQPGAQVLSKQHEAHVAQLANLGVLALGGTCGEQAEGSDALVELCVIDAPSLEKARRYVEQDPAVIAGHLRAEFVSWLGPKGLCLKLPAPAPAPAPAQAPAAAAAAEGAAPGVQPAAQPMQVNPKRPNAGKAKPDAPAPAGAAAPAAPAAAPAAAPVPAADPAGKPAAKPAGKTKPAPGSVPPPKTSPKS